MIGMIGNHARLRLPKASDPRAIVIVNVHGEIASVTTVTAVTPLWTPQRRK